MPDRPPSVAGRLRLGISGTRTGMTEAQRTTATAIIRRAGEMHHGDCVGADADAHALATAAGVPTVTHPPVDGRLRAYTTATCARPPLPYLTRNRMIVAATDLLLAVPAEPAEQARGGTWYTVRHARRAGKPVVIIWPDGSTAAAGRTGRAAGGCWR